MGVELRRAMLSDGSLYGLSFHCPGCGFGHIFTTDWTFNGDMEKPTFSPSLLNYNPRDKSYRCHLFVRDGRIEFCGDCSHSLAGKTVEMEDEE